MSKCPNCGEIISCPCVLKDTPKGKACPKCYPKVMAEIQKSNP